MKAKISFLILITALIFGCNTKKSIPKNKLKKAETKTISYTDNMESFKIYTHEFEANAKDSSYISKINKSGIMQGDLMLKSFLDTNELRNRTHEYSKEMGYSLTSNYEHIEEGFTYESSIIYYFKYDAELKSFIITNLMMAG